MRLGAAKVIACGLCFPWAYQQTVDDESEQTVLVHARVKSPTGNPPYRYDHAWIERSGIVQDWQTMVVGEEQGVPWSLYQEHGWPIQTFYAAFRPTDLKKYDQEQALIAAVRGGHHGPWSGPPPTRRRNRHAR